MEWCPWPPGMRPQQRDADGRAVGVTDAHRVGVVRGLIRRWVSHGGDFGVERDVFGVG
jgi:hypothetical protein